MKTQRCLLHAAVLLTFLFTCTTSFAQNRPGKIIRAAPAGAVRAALDSNADDFVSASTSGFSGNDDVTTSEIAFKPIVPYSQEPHSDLRRGPSHNFTDFVPGIDNASYYMFYRNTAGSEALLFRMRLGSVIPGAKGYSVLFDTDGKFGATGPNADPNYMPATTGIGGNPGFEVEIVLATGGGNDGVLIYNVDGIDNASTPTVLSGWTAYSQLSIAATNDNGDPDFYLDWYVPLSALNAAGITAATQLRVVPTTVMAPKGAIGGPKSDIYGLNDNSYKDPNKEYEDFINAQPSFKLTDLSGSGTASPTRSMCTAAPAITSNISPGASVTVSGTWAKSSLSGATGTAFIYLYKNGGTIPVAQTAVAVNSGAGWSIAGVSVSNGDVFTAKAQAPFGESRCLVSNAVTASLCNGNNTPAQPILACYSTSKGISGSNLATGWRVHVDNITRNTQENSTANAGGFFGANSGTSPTINWQYSGGCSSGSPLTSGAYKVYYVDVASGCASAPAYVCVAGNGGTALAGSIVVPTITTPASGTITTATKTISGTTDAGASVTLYVDSVAVQTLPATGGNFSFGNLSFSQGQKVQINAEYNTGTVSTSKCAAQTALLTVSCFTTSPAVTTDANSQLKAGQAITGVSGEPAGTVIRVYTSAGSLVSTTSVQSNGTWSTANAGSTPASYTAAAGTSYYAQAQNGTCGASTNTATFATPTPTNTSRCGAITATVPVSAPLTFTNSVTGLSGSLGTAVVGTTVNIYQDGELIGTTTSGTTAWGNPTPVDVTGKLYSGGVLMLGIKEGSNAEVTCPTTYTVTCSPPTAPTMTFLTCTNCGTPADPTKVGNNGTITYRVSNLQGNSYYALREQSTGKALSAGTWTAATPPSFIDVATYPMTSGGNFTAEAVGTFVSASGMCSAKASQSYNVVLPVTLVEFKGQRKNGVNELRWKSANETAFRQYTVERSCDGLRFETIGQVAATGAGSYLFSDAAFSSSTYYRLKLVNNNGSFGYSAVLLIKGGNALSIGFVKPNPFVNEVELQVNAANNESITLVLLDEKGKLVARKQTTAVSGANTVRLSNLSHLASGLYLLQVLTGDEVLQQKVVKLP